jgi:branched-chain amino acid transport system ATP-binding protein
MFGKKGMGSVSQAKQKARAILEFTGLSEKGDYLPRSLTIADLKRLELARALATSPEILLLDEIVAGLNTSETIEAMELVNKIRRELGITIFVIEHVMKVVMGISDRIMVLHYGMKIAEGSPKDVAEDKTVIDAYLGEKYVL